jgi:hypothetical protein
VARRRARQAVIDISTRLIYRKAIDFIDDNQVDGCMVSVHDLAAHFSTNAVSVLCAIAHIDELRRNVRAAAVIGAADRIGVGVGGGGCADANPDA